MLKDAATFKMRLVE